MRAESRSIQTNRKKLEQHKTTTLILLNIVGGQKKNMDNWKVWREGVFVRVCV